MLKALFATITEELSPSILFLKFGIENTEIIPVALLIILVASTFFGIIYLLMSRSFSTLK